MSDIIEFLGTWREMGWVSAMVLGCLILVLLLGLVVWLSAFWHPESREMRDMRRQRRKRVKAMKLLRSTADRDCFRDVRGTTR